MVVSTMNSSKRKHKSTDDQPMSSSDDESSPNFGSATEGNPGWADSIANVLNTNKPKTKKTLVLSKAKNLNKVKTEKQSYDFQIEGEDNEEEKPYRTSSILDESETKKNKKEPLNLRVKPTLADRERERALKKIATKGVVQLFNAVRTQQKDIEQKLRQEKFDHRKDAVLNNINKKKFLDTLMSGERAKSEFVDNFVKKEESKKEHDMDTTQEPQWSALRDDFMTGKKYKNWDQAESDDEQHKSSDSTSSDTE